jgi:hypothetical protein
MSIKNINIKLPADEHARMVEAAKRELTSLSSLLRRCFAEHERGGSHVHKPHTQPQQPAEPKLNKREQAFEKWKVLCTQAHENMTLDETQAMIAEVKRLKAEGGNITTAEMPIPKACLLSHSANISSGNLKTREQALAEARAEYGVSDKHKNTSLEELRRLEAAATTYEEGQMLRNLIGSREQIARDEARERGELED